MLLRLVLLVCSAVAATGCLADDFDGATLGSQWTDSAGGDGQCFLSGSGTLICRNADDGAHIRTTDTFETPLTISGSLDKTDECSDQYIKVSTQGSDSGEPWYSRSGFVTFVWDCNWRYIYGQSMSVGTSCPSFQTYDIEITVDDSTVTFRDAAGVCDDLSLAETIGTSAFLYAYVGADADPGFGDAVWHSVEVCGSGGDSSSPTTRPTTPRPTLSPRPTTSEPTALPTTSEPTALPSALPTSEPTALPSTALPSTPPTLLPTRSPRPTPHPTLLPTQRFTLSNIMADSTIRLAVEAWLSNPTFAEAIYGHISRWGTGGVTDMSRLFDGARAFNEDIGAWDTSGVTSMNSMFNDALSFDQDIGGWRVDKVTNMYRMFDDASSFDQDLGWCVDDNVNLVYAFEDTRCESTSCGVIQGTCPPSPAPTTSAPTPRPTREDEGDSDVGALVASLCVVGAFLVVCGIIYAKKYYSSKSAKVAAVPNNAATDDGDTITVEAPPGTLGLKFDGTSTRVKEVFSDSPLVGKVYPGDVLKSVNGVLTFGTYLATAADDCAAYRTLVFLRKKQPMRPATIVRMGTVEAVHAADASAAPPVQATLVPHATVLSVQQP